MVIDGKHLRVLQIVVEESVLKPLMVQWENSHEPASLMTSGQLAAENFCLLSDLAKSQGVHKVCAFMPAEEEEGPIAFARTC